MENLEKHTPDEIIERIRMEEIINALINESVITIAFEPFKGYRIIQ